MVAVGPDLRGQTRRRLLEYSTPYIPALALKGGRATGLRRGQAEQPGQGGGKEESCERKKLND